ncbi:YdcF family protein [Gemmatimonas sp.]|uniref:YdcF family protein n=1 Tax=Gemmatimonas sp. TaxID=1962908 RepID=UPI00391AEFDE
MIRRTVVVLAAGWFVSLLGIAGWSRRSSSETADAIVVLGAAQYGGRPSPVLKSRLDHALELWEADRAPHVVLTGGRRPGDLISEAAAGRRYLVRRGIPNDSMMLEPAGRTSLASIRGAAELLTASRARGGTMANGPTESGERPRPRVLLVSDPFHMLRLDVLARMNGLTPLPSPTRTSPISANRAVLEYMLRESVALPTDIALMVWLTMTGRTIDGEQTSD